MGRRAAEGTGRGGCRGAEETPRVPAAWATVALSTLSLDISPLPSPPLLAPSGPPSCQAPLCSGAAWLPVCPGPGAALRLGDLVLWPVCMLLDTAPVLLGH